MGKTTLETGVGGLLVHGRTTAGDGTSQVIVIGVDGSDSVFDPNDLVPLSASTANVPCAGTSVGTSDTHVIDENGSRIEATLCNDDATAVVYLALGETAVLNQGVRLNPGGGTYTTPAGYTGPVSAIATEASTNVCWTEV